MTVTQAILVIAAANTFVKTSSATTEFVCLMGGACHVDVMLGILGPTVKQN